MLYSMYYIAVLVIVIVRSPENKWIQHIKNTSMNTNDTGKVANSTTESAISATLNMGRYLLELMIMITFECDKHCI